MNKILQDSAYLKIFYYRIECMKKKKMLALLKVFLNKHKKYNIKSLLIVHCLTISNGIFAGNFVNFTLSYTKIFSIK